MIRDYEHAKAVQQRRKEAGKNGLAKAVIRWLKRNDVENRYRRELMRD